MSACGLLAGISWASACSGPPVVDEVLAVNQVRLSDGTIVTYAGLESPESGSEMFEAARRANADLVFGITVNLVVVRIEHDEDDSVEAFVYTPVIADGKTRQLFVNRELVLYGYARAINVAVPNGLAPDLWGDVARAEQTAKAEGVGLWAGKSTRGSP